MTPEARKWARPDLDWRPSGYQPDAPTRLSYGPARRRKTTNRLKDSFEERPPTPGHPLIAYRARDVDRISAGCHAAIGTRFGFSTGRPERMRDPRFEPLEPELEGALGRKLRSVSGDAERVALAHESVPVGIMPHNPIRDHTDDDGMDRVVPPERSPERRSAIHREPHREPRIRVGAAVDGVNDPRRVAPIVDSDSREDEFERGP